MENLFNTKKLRLTSDFSLGHHGDWGDIRKMRMIGNFRVIKGIYQVMICYVSLQILIRKKNRETYQMVIA